MFRTLVVDDEHPIREWLVYTIRSHRPDFYVDSAQNGLEAIHKANLTTFDLVITDIRMPHMDGLELLEQLHRISPKTAAIVLSSYDDFNYVRSAFKYYAVDYLLKSEIDDEKLLLAIDHIYLQQTDAYRAAALIPEIKTALKNPSLSSSEFLQRLSDIGDYVPQKNWFCLLMKSDPDRENPRFHLPTEDNIASLFCINLDSGLFISCIEMDLQPSMLLLMQQQILYIKKLQTYNTPSLLIYSQIYSQPHNLLSVLQQIYSARNLEFYGITFHQLPHPSAQSDLLIEEHYLQIQEAVRARNKNDVLQRTDQMLEFARKVLYPNIEELKLLCTKLCEAVYQNSNRMDLMEYHNYIKLLSPQLFAAKEWNEFVELVRQALSDLYKKNTPGIGSISSRIDKVISIVEAEYMNQITLTSVAEMLHVNSEYLSRSFKKEMGINFNTYLNNVRLQHALDMLKNSEARVAEIAVQTGYQNPAYFSKCFKTAFGLSPQQWKNSEVSKTDQKSKTNIT